MLRGLMLAASVIAAFRCLQKWSDERRDRLMVRTIELPRWEDEGGSPAPETRADTPDPLRDQD